MSEAVGSPLVPVVQYDPRVNLKPATEYAVKKGGSNETLNNFPSSSYSNSQVNFLPIVPNMDTIVSRNAQVTFYYETTITGTTDQATMSDCIGLLMAPRANPNASVINTINSTINNTSVSINLSNCISVLQKYNIGVEDNLKDLSTFPSMLDFFQNYNEGFGTAIDPLQAIGNSGYQQPRGGFGNIQVVSSTPTSLVIRFSSTEPLYLSPWMIEESHSAGLFGVNNLSMNMVLGDLNRAWSINTASVTPNITVTNMVTTLYAAPEILMTFIQPSNIQELPKSIPYSYSTVEEYQTDYGTVAGNASFTITSQNIQLTSIPKRIYIMARRRNQDQTYATSDVFANIKGVSVQFDVQSGLLASANEQQLYKMSAYNGYQGSWSQWHKYTGSVLALDFGRDICLQNPAEAVGLGNVKKNFQVSVNFTNLNVNPVYYTLFVIVVSDGLFTLSSGTSITQTGILSQSDILTAVETSRLDAPRPNNFYGGSILSKGLKYLQKGAKAVEKYGPRALLTAQRVSSGDYLGAVKSAATGKGFGQGLVGGKMMTKSELMNRRGMMLGSGSSEPKQYKSIDYSEDYDDDYDC